MMIISVLLKMNMRHQQMSHDDNANILNEARLMHTHGDIYEVRCEKLKTYLSF